MEDNNTIIEINTDVINESIKNTIISDNEIKIELNKNQKTKKVKTKKEFFWKRMSKKTKIIISVILLSIVLIAGGICLYFFVLKKEKPEPAPKENIVLEKDNYIYKNGTLTFLDSEGKELGTYKCKDEDTEKCFIAKLSNEDTFDLPLYVDKKGHAIEKGSKIYNDNYVFVYDDSQINLYNIADKKVEDTFSLIKTGDIEEDFIVAKNKEEKYGMISFANDYETIINFDYEYLGIANNEEVFVAKEDQKYFLLDSDEKRISGYFLNEVKSFDDKYVAIANGEKYSLYDYAGNEVLESEYDYIDFNSSYVFTILDNKMYAYDSNLNQLNNGIKIKSSNYQKKYIFDENNNLSDTKKAYNITVNRDGTIVIEDTSSKSSKTINVFESVLSSNYNYVSYIDGQLYFYKDTDKTELLGTYKCNNQNKVDASTSSFANCFVAKEFNIINGDTASGFVPIFNDNYVFINDSKNETSNIVLFDLKSNTQKAKYQAIDTGLGNDEITMITNVNSLIFAKNTDGNYGVITFKEGTPVGVISFKEDGNGTSKLAYLENYIIATRGSLNYLYTKTGELLATSKFKIQEYKDDYLVVKDKNYLVYKMSNPESGSIISNEMDYIKLYDDFFIGIKNKKLNVYLLSDAKHGVLKDALEVKLTEYVNAYKVTIYSDSYVISIMQGNDASVDYKFDKDWSVIKDEEQ